MLKIGDFSRLTRVSIRMLRYYDEIGLLPPAAIDQSSGYRYYSAGQIETVHLIKSLREMGFGFPEIAEWLKESGNTRRLLDLLDMRKQEIAETIEQENEKLLRVGRMLEHLTKEDSTMDYTIALKSVPAYRVLSLRDIIPAYNAEGVLWEEISRFAQVNGIKMLQPCYAIYHDQGYKEQDVDVEVTLHFEGEAPESERIHVKELEAEPQMAVLFHSGPFEEMSKAYQALGVWMSGNGYGMAGAIRAIYHKGPWSEKNPADYLTEIQVPVVKGESTSIGPAAG
ncbi:MerR family transcriptional regulator [Paenibacillus sp. 7124]|uniref:MerR family transcriptional regulator n=1 Tax=Paenibacillus apii TaxID=1850370 RepID=A0A6M1PCD0_9BACL|nr:MerR family transcriptional regulator [Paenibacillus apii]NGM80847.1 MerR family transcriptional regulator [Paenibacillus apii]